MLRREIKALYYGLTSMPMWVNGRIYRLFRAPASHCPQAVKVHLGPGRNNYLEGWINLDANIISARRDLWANLEDPLPFRRASVDLFYSHHVIEHLPDTYLVKHFRQMHAALKPGGFIRVGGPNGDMAIRKYLEGDSEWFGDFPDARDSIGGKFANFLLCRNEHRTILSPSYLEEIALKAGFTRVAECIAGQTTSRPKQIGPEILRQESWSSPTHPHTVIVEAFKE